ncbi:MAG: D-glycero-beta-D-manno-heptose 1-phosphate adenylyltransferase [Betaproteobacteria bacterium]|nr:D-glycero-beta-D-manno-heptose 1-phosphate adenylyltransferase [Betaproteobacteria bacterium]
MGMLSFEKKIVSPGDCIERVRSLPRPLVFTNGVFDILHRGHITYLAQARSLGSALVVALNSDQSVKRLGKGADRPINTLTDRLAVIASLEAVSLVTWFEEDTPIKRIEDIVPDILVKGGDWSVENIVGADIVKSHGGSVYSIPFEHDRSTTQLITKIRRL